MTGLSVGFFAAVVALMAAVAADEAKNGVVYELADLAFDRLVSRNCYETYDQQNCNTLSDMSATDVRLYFGGLLGNDTVMAMLPDNEAQLNRPHDAFLVLDPFPAYKFGHPMFMFYADFNDTASTCENTEGIFTILDDNSTACVHMVRSRRCNERPMTSTWDCQVTFLPMVVPTRSEHSQANNVLQCMATNNSFLMNCPEIKDYGTQLSDECNHLKTNNRGCRPSQFQCSEERPINTALMLYGGWSRNVADFITMYDLVSLRNRLKDWGFSEHNMKTYFANGINTALNTSHADDDDDDDTDYPMAVGDAESADKLNIRRYIKGVCNAPGCVETFFLYLSSPSRKDGSALLWDSDGNGYVESDEIYSTKEFLHDISFCSARRVVVFVDQSYSGQLPQHAQLAINHLENVMIVPTTRADDWIPRHWFNGYMRESSRTACLHEYIKPFEESQVMPTVFTGVSLEQEMRNVSILGITPCV